MAVYQEKDDKGNIKATKDGASYFYKVSINGKQVKSKKYTTKKDALNAERLFLLKEDKPVFKTLGIVAVDYFDYLKKHNKYSTYQTSLYAYNKHIKPYFENVELSKIDVTKVRKWHDTIEKLGFSERYNNKLNSVAIQIVEHAVKNYNLSKNIFRIYGGFTSKNEEIHEDEKLRYITLEEFKQFIAVVDDPLYHALFMTFFWSGCRKGELYALKVNDVNFTDNTISITKTLGRSDGVHPYTLTSTKTNQNRKIKMNKSLREELQSYINKLKEYDDFNSDWFLFGDVNPIARSTVDRYKHKYFELSGVREITLHEFRHSAVSCALNALLTNDTTLDINKALIILSSRFGHSPEVMMKIYAHLYKDNLQDEVVNLLDNL